MRVMFGGLVGAVPGVLLIPVLEFYAMLVLVPMGVIAGAMIGSAQSGQITSTAIGVGVGLLVGVPLSLVGTGPAVLLAPAVVLAGGIAGKHWGDEKPTPTPPAIQH
jgi:hypothetical protein